jgi:lactoylglutathione lyase
MALVCAIAHSCVGVSDLGRSLSFYRDALGLEEVRRTELANGTTLVLLGCAGKRDEALIELAWRPGLESPAAGAGDPGNVPSPSVGHRHVAFWVDDVHQAVARVEQLGYAIARRPASPGSGVGTVAFVKDPDGADIELMQR